MLTIKSYSLEKATVNKLFLVTALFLYIYNVNFRFLPLGLRTRFVIGCVGIVFFVFNKLPKPCVTVLYCYVLCVFFGLLASIFHLTFDFWYVQYLILDTIALFGAGALTHLMILRYRIDIFQILKYVVLCILIHNVISFLGLFISPVQTVLNAIQIIDNQALVESMMQSKMRAIGVGDGNYFHGGMISSIGIILTIYLVSINKISFWKGATSAIVLLISGIFIARTTLLGLSGFVMYFFVRNKSNRCRIKKLFFLFGSMCFLSILLLLTFAGDYINIGWAFELFLNYINNGSIETASSNDLATMWVLPNNNITLLFGDGKMINDDSSYYMHTDVGFLRHIYFWGAIGMSFFLLTQLFTVREISVSNYNLRPLACTIMLFFLLLNLKGLIDLTWFLFLLLFLSVYGKETHRIFNK